jgi:hypothetical protein
MRGVLVPTTVNAEVGKAQKEFEGMLSRSRSRRWSPSGCSHSGGIPMPSSAGSTTGGADDARGFCELEEVANGVMLTVTESGFDRIPLERRAKAFTANEQGWSMMVKEIEEYLVQAP